MKDNKKNVDLKEEDLQEKSVPETQSEQSKMAEDNQEMAEQESAEPTIEEKFEKLTDDYLRLMAEYDNYRKRTLKEKSELQRNGGERVLVDLLPVIDDFALALKNIPDSEEYGSVKEGIQLIHNKFVEYLNRQGVKAIETKDKVFDEELHEAIAVVPATSDGAKGMIVDCVKTGYTLNDKVIRHSSVVVSK